MQKQSSGGQSEQYDTSDYENVITAHYQKAKKYKRKSKKLYNNLKKLKNHYEKAKYNISVLEEENSQLRGN